MDTIKAGIDYVLVIAGMIIVYILFVIGIMGIRLSSTGIGEYRGYITAVDQTGLIYQNYKVYFKTDNSSSQEDVYCINRANLALIEKAKAVNKARQLITVTYKGIRGYGWDLCRGEELQTIE